MDSRPIYLDYNATTPVDPEVAAAMRPYLEEVFGNPSSGHWFGRQARQAVDRARKQVAGLLGAAPDEILFTSGGSEANNLALKGAALARRDHGDHIVTTAIEHPAVLEVCAWLQEQGFTITRLPVDGRCLVNPADLRDALTPRTILVSVMHANNETGAIQPIAELADLARQAGALFHCDAAQSVGKIPTDVQELGVDLLSVAGHKFYGPKGVGALYIRRGVTLEKLIHGANHESNLRAGTENVLEIVGLGAAAELAGSTMAESMDHCRRLRDRLWQGLRTELPDIRLNGPLDLRLPGTLNVSFPGIEAGLLLAAVPEIAASAGAACHADGVSISSVIAAMGVPEASARGTVRFSTGKFLCGQEIDRAVGAIVAAVHRLGA
jgi:cysteine desulfurase